VVGDVKGEGFEAENQDGAGGQKSKGALADHILAVVRSRPESLLTLHPNGNFHRRIFFVNIALFTASVAFPNSCVRTVERLLQPTPRTAFSVHVGKQRAALRICCCRHLHVIASWRAPCFITAQPKLLRYFPTTLGLRRPIELCYKIAIREDGSNLSINKVQYLLTLPEGAIPAFF
jgi:hypothetical protein